MNILLNFARAYPWRSLLTLLCLLVAGLADGLSLSTLLSLLTVTVDAGNGAAGAAMAEANTQGLGPARIMLDAFAAVGLEPTAGVLLVFVVVGMTIKGLLLLVANGQVGFAVAHVATDLRLALLRAMMQARWEYYLRQPVGALSNAFATEAMRASSAYLYGATVVALLAQALVYSGVALLISWRVTVVALGAGLLVMVAVGGLVRMSRKAGKKQTRLLKSLLARLTDALGSVKPLKAMGREELADTVLRADTEKLNRALRKQVVSKEALPALQDPMIASLVAVGLYVALAQLHLELTGVLVIVFLLARVMGYLTKVQREYQKMVTCDSAYWSLREAIADAQAAREPNHGGREPTLEKGIELRDLVFHYGTKRVLDGLRLTLPAGEFAVLIGPSGSGKTTVVDLICGLLRPEQGEVLIDGVALDEIDLRQWRHLIGYVPQEHLLLHDTLLHNVTLGDPALDEEDARRALEAAGAGEFIAQLPEGLMTVVGERGGKLSGGQRQRVVIARALVHRPRLLILDEATSALDPATAREVGHTLRALHGDLTILAISHTPALVEVADRVLRMHHGRVEAVKDGDLASVAAG